MSKKGTKGSKTEVSSYEIADIVLGKVRGYPPWPGRVADPASIPSTVVKERPPLKKGVVHCVQFFPAGDFSWLSPKDISKLKPNEIESYIAEHPEVRRSGDLLLGYKIARDPREWARDMADRAAAKAAEAVDEDTEGEGDEEDELADDGERPAASKKRKTPSGNASASAATKKRKRNSEPGVKPKPTTTTNKGPGKGRKSRAAIESEDEEDAQEAQAANNNAPTASPPPTKKAKTLPGKEENTDDAELAKDPEATKVREWRHKLQKVFLSSKVQAPRQEDMPDMNDLFTHIETYDKINIAYLSFSKIGKVMRHITALSDDRVPMDSQYKFRDRAKVLVERWQHIINASRVDGKELSKPPAKDSGFGLKNSATNGMESKNSFGEASQSPDVNNGANENVNGIADAINTSIATGTMEIDDGAPAKVNGNGHFNGGEDALVSQLILKRSMLLRRGRFRPLNQFGPFQVIISQFLIYVPFSNILFSVIHVVLALALLTLSPCLFLST
ncbi:hypothetical protein J3R30DRAFT_3277408 [Lentinula aciculospora]|uniref:PWWP domain-containing protein n=1 Tax=Lentinula aciculospora TaxID=153920 RepID=A0A9W9AUN7_9AGAR|nr:hypothetical protein J3R30DRAFT_3277408 [Lentinula aciculospora]